MCCSLCAAQACIGGHDPMLQQLQQLEQQPCASPQLRPQRSALNALTLSPSNTHLLQQQAVSRSGTQGGHRPDVSTSQSTPQVQVGLCQHSSQHLPLLASCCVLILPVTLLASS